MLVVLLIVGVWVIATVAVVALCMAAAKGDRTEVLPAPRDPWLTP